MKPPPRPSLRPSRPSPQAGQARGSLSGLFGSGGKKCGPSSWSSASMTSLIDRSLVSATFLLKAFQNCASTVFQSLRPPETSSSWVSMSAVKLYST